MLTALFSDIHANREALDACLADARRQGVRRFAFLGDLIGYGADPAYVVDIVAELNSAGALVIKGNHDAALSDPFVRLNSYARAALEWTRRALNDSQKAFLAQLPLTAELGDMLLVHAEAHDPERWIYISQPFEAQRSMDATNKRITASGHVHRPILYHVTEKHEIAWIVPSTDEAIDLSQGKWHAILGSVGQPRDEIPAAAYALYDEERSGLTFRRVDYDIESAARKINAAGLPALLSARLYVGR